MHVLIYLYILFCLNIFTIFFFSSRRRHTRSLCDWSSDVCSSDLWVEFTDFAMEPGTPDASKVVKSTEWGEAVRGMQVKVAAGAQTNTPTLKVTLRNSGGEDIMAPLDRKSVV